MVLDSGASFSEDYVYDDNSLSQWPTFDKPRFAREVDTIIVSG